MLRRPAACSVQAQGGTQATFSLHNDLLDSAAAANRCAADGGMLVFYESQEAYLCKKVPGAGMCGRAELVCVE